MTASYTTLSAIDRALVRIPRDPWSVAVERVENETVVRVSNFDGDVVLRATPVSHICCNVRVETFPNIGGQRNRPGRVIEFSTSHAFVEDWVEMALSEAA